MVTEGKSRFPGESAFDLPGKMTKERIEMKSNNQINVPQAREAMDKFKMQAASDLDVPVTY